MDAVYRHQRHIYDATRKYYLLGRDRLIADLAPPQGGTVLEVGCGTGRNLILAARRWPHTRLYGLDISEEMLATARAAIERSGLSHRITVGQGDASAFDANAVFGVPAFDRVFQSYTLSMIPDWQGAIREAMRHLKPGGELHVVDFGQQERLPRAFRAALFAWLQRFHVEPRARLEAALADTPGIARRDFTSLWRGYAWQARAVRA
jgi:S-adenosylmethionine-diacylgycerolhomoserine-N-methlytransferase